MLQSTDQRARQRARAAERKTLAARLLSRLPAEAQHEFITYALAFIGLAVTVLALAQRNQH